MSSNDYISQVAASPKVRKFARELGVDINQISGSERKGRVTENDIKDFISSNFNQKEKIKDKDKDKVKEHIKNKLEYLHSEFGEIEKKIFQESKNFHRNT